jgi:hypothetical protein
MRIFEYLFLGLKASYFSRTVVPVAEHHTFEQGGQTIGIACSCRTILAFGATEAGSLEDINVQNFVLPFDFHDVAKTP